MPSWIAVIIAPITTIVLYEIYRMFTDRNILIKEELHMQAQSSDIGLAIRDFLEDTDISVFATNKINSELTEYPAAREISFIDMSNSHSPKIVLDNGQRFIVTITPEVNA